METISIFQISLSLGCVVLGFVLADWRDKRGLSIFRGVKRQYHGSASDLRIFLSQRCDEKTGQITECDLKGDFARAENKIYIYDHFNLKLYNKKIYIYGDGHMELNGGNKRTFSVKGWGRYLLGNSEKGIILAILDGQFGHERGKIAQIIRYSDPQTLRGYWIADDSHSFGRLVLGQLELDSD